MVEGYAGKFLKVDLSRSTICKPALDFNLARKYIGGRGFGAKLLWDSLDRGVDPLSEDNLILFLVGPITGIAPGAVTCICFKSPETGTIGHSTTTGHWGAELKFAGYDGVLVSGKADAPEYLYVRDEDVQLKEARHLWGEGTTKAEAEIKKELDDPFAKVLTCGPAGENLATNSSIIQGSWHAAARGGGGAVMGSKMLKAIAVRGTGGVKIHRPEECYRLLDEFTERLSNIGPRCQRYRYRRYGTTTSTIRDSSDGVLAVKNYSEGDWGEIEHIGGVKLERRNMISQGSCYSCVAGCFHVSVVRSGRYAGTVSQIDYDSSAMLGPNCLVTDIDGLMYLNALCDELGLDAEGSGDIISWAMECYERGIFTKNDLDDIDLSWGSVPSMIDLLKKIAFREGVGNLLADGLRCAPDRVGKGSEKFAMHCKGMGFGGHHPADHVMGLQYAIGDRGGCHHYGQTNDNQNWRAWADSLTCCSFHEIIGVDYMKLFEAATGFELVNKREDWDLIAERILILSRAFNIREGIVPIRDDVLPEKVHTHRLTYGKGKGKYYPKKKFEKDRARWYKSRGCDEYGIPTKEHLRTLGLDFVIQKLYKT